MIVTGETYIAVMLTIIMSSVREEVRRGCLGRLGRTLNASAFLIFVRHFIYLSPLTFPRL